MIKNRTPVGDLSGSVDGLTPVNQFGYTTVDGGGGTANTSFAEIIYASLSLTATETINVGFIRHTQPADRNDNGGTLRIREDDINGAILSTGGFGAGNGNVTFDQSTTIFNQAVGSRTYVFTYIQTGNPGDFVRLHSGASSMAYIVDINDTHAGAAKPLNQVIMG